MSKKINVLVVPSDFHGVGMYRSLSPHQILQEMYEDDFNIEFNYQPDWANPSKFDNYDIIHIHKGLYMNMDVFWNALAYFKEHNIVVIIDIDDNWDLGPQHPLYHQSRAAKNGEKVVKNLALADYVTTTTSIFANKIRKINKNVVIFPNSINPDEEQYKPIKNMSSKIRFGFVMGSAHEKDMEQIKGVVASLPQDVFDKIQIVLCGYDLRGNVNVLDKDGKVVEQRPIAPKESVWYRYEQTVTNDYKIVSPEYKDFLMKFIPDSQWPNVDNEHYRREWTKPVTEFAKHYRNIDVLLAPLEENEFNAVKSELKLIEGGFTKTAVICSNFGPYTIGTTSLFKRGGEIDENGNCVLIEPRQKHKMWAKAITKLVRNPELIVKLQENLSKYVKENYDIHDITKKRAEWYKQIVKK